MIFTPEHCALILEQRKTQTRRIVKTGERPYLVKPSGDGVIQCVYTANSQLKWRVGTTYAVQPGRGKSAVGRIRITQIDIENVQDISADDCMAEGVTDFEWLYEWSETVQVGEDRYGPVLAQMPYSGWVSEGYAVNGDGPYDTPQDAYADLWNSINTRPGTRWEDNPLVWRLGFELVREG